MSTETLQPVLIDNYGGICTLIDRSDVPVGLSPDCQNVEFFPGGVRSRAGFRQQTSTPLVNIADAFSYTTDGGVRKMLAMVTWGEILTGGVEDATLIVTPLGDVAARTRML